MSMKLLFPKMLWVFVMLTGVGPAQGQWSRIPLPGDHPEVFALVTHTNGELFIGTGGLPNSTTNAIGILSSDDQGTTVTARCNGLKNTRFDRLFRSLINSDQSLVAASADGTYFSENGGENWEKRANGLPVLARTSMQSANALVSLGDQIFCGTPEGVYKTVDQGIHWLKTSSGLTNPDVRALARLDKLLFASTDGDGIYRSSDGGANWTRSGQGIPANVHSRALIANDGVVLAGTTMGTYRSVDQGETWTTTLPNANARSFAAGNGLIAVGAFRGNGIVYVSYDRGEHWTNVSGNLPSAMGVWAMALDDTNLYAAVARQGLWRIPLSELKTLQNRPDAGTSPNTGGTPLPQERLGRRGNLPGVRQNLLALDSNGDGKLTRDEIPPRVQRILSEADIDGDDVLDSEEIAGFLRQIGPGSPN